MREKEKPSNDEATCDNNWLEKSAARFHGRYLVAAIVLALLNALTLTVRGTPWGITSAFALWGGKFLNTVGIDVASWGYFTGPTGEALKNSVLADSTSVLNFGIILGAFIAASFPRHIQTEENKARYKLGPPSLAAY